MRQLQGLEGGDAIVDGDDQPGLALQGGSDGPRADPVSVAVPVGKHVVAFGSDRFEEIEEEGGARDAVGVVVAENEDQLLVANCPGDPFDCTGHVFQKLGGVQGLRSHREIAPLEAAALQKGFADRGIGRLALDVPDWVLAHFGYR